MASLSGLINVLKPPGMTSHDVINYIRRLYGLKKVGHTGTLDPAAAGVLPVCLGQATRIIEYLADDKEYRAEVAFGTKTSTGDAYGDIVSTQNPSGLSQRDVEKVLNEFKGEIMQVPPMTSAVRHNGKKLYELARKGMVVERKARRAVIHSLGMVKWTNSRGASPVAIIDVSCSAGTYIRTLCTDIGDRLGCGAYMSFLLRIRAGFFPIAQSFTLEELRDLAVQGRLEQAVTSMENVLTNLPEVRLRVASAASVSSGSRIYVPGVESTPEVLPAGQTVKLTLSSRLMAIAITEFIDERPSFKPVKVFV